MSSLQGLTRRKRFDGEPAPHAQFDSLCTFLYKYLQSKCRGGYLWYSAGSHGVVLSTPSHWNFLCNVHFAMSWCYVEVTFRSKNTCHLPAAALFVFNTILWSLRKYHQILNIMVHLFAMYWLLYTEDYSQGYEFLLHCFDGWFITLVHLWIVWLLYTEDYSHMMKYLTPLLCWSAFYSLHFLSPSPFLSLYLSLADSLRMGIPT